jgi:hypothetical protein
MKQGEPPRPTRHVPRVCIGLACPGWAPGLQGFRGFEAFCQTRGLYTVEPHCLRFGGRHKYLFNCSVSENNILKINFCVFFVLSSFRPVWASFGLILIGLIGLVLNRSGFSNIYITALV